MPAEAAKIIQEMTHQSPHAVGHAYDQARNLPGYQAQHKSPLKQNSVL